MQFLQDGLPDLPSVAEIIRPTSESVSTTRQTTVAARNARRNIMDAAAAAIHVRISRVV